MSKIDLIASISELIPENKKGELKGFLEIAKTPFWNEETSAMILSLLKIKQFQLFQNWESNETEAQKKFLSELLTAHQSYPGGIPGYTENAKILLEDAKKGVNAFEGYTPHQPDRIDLSTLSPIYQNYEQIGSQNLDKLAVVLVAGGLGERLGYSGIKIGIPVEVMTHTTYLSLYANAVLAIEMRSGKTTPLIIMTSRDTHDRTLSELESQKYFGLKKEQVIVLRQELVPAICDNEGTLALEKKYEVVMKPHGHGDIHMLLHTSGTAKKLAEMGKEYLLFIQDTNGQVFNAAVAALGVSIKENFDFNSMAVNRVPKEAVGALTKLIHKNGHEMTLNVEYNLLDPLLRSTVNPAGDVPNEKGLSLFPGNINILLVKISTYLKTLESTKGIIAEFVNPKYSDDTRTSFKKPTRLETLMQDLPKLFKSGEKTGVTIFDRRWCFSADKNNVGDAKAKFETNSPPESAATAESDIYLAGRMKAIYANNVVEPGEQILILGIPFENSPKIFLKPNFALTLGEVREKIKNCKFSKNSSLILNGNNIRLNNVVLNGSASLVINAANGAEVNLSDITLNNDGFEMDLLSNDDLKNEPEFTQIRGYRFKKNKAVVLTFDKPGIYNIDQKDPSFA